MCISVCVCVHSYQSVYIYKAETTCYTPHTPPPPPPHTHTHTHSQRNRVSIVPCISLNGHFDPLRGFDYLSIIMRYFANVILYPLVKPFILLFSGLTLTFSVIFICHVEIGLDRNLFIPKVHVRICTRKCVQGGWEGGRVYRKAGSKGDRGKF